MTSILATAQFCTPDDRFSDAEYFSSNEIDSVMDVTYGNAINWLGNAEDLEMDYYFPANTIDPIQNRPLILLIHGGGFTGGDKSSKHDECREFAKRGFVAATINYRLGYDGSAIESVKAVYRADQDANASLRYFIDNATPIGIDTSWIFVGGSSAGAITSFFTTYTSQENWSGIFPGIEALLGSLDTSGNNLTHTFSIQGIFNNWGAGAPSSIEPSELIPTISFHGALDGVVPIGEGSNGLIGSQLIHDLHVAQGICSDLTIDPLGDHGIYDTPSGTIFRISNASCFFKSIFCNTCTTVYTEDPIIADCSTTTGIDDIDLKKEIVVYPNPFEDNLNITGLYGNEYFYLFNSIGDIVYEGNEIQNHNFRKLHTGLYLLSIRDGHGSQSIKVYKD